MNTVRARLRLAACAAAAVTAAVTAGGCTAQPAGGGTPRPPGGGTSSLSQATASSRGSIPTARAKDARADRRAARVPLKVPNSVQDRKTVTLTGCTATSVDGRAAGTVTAARTATYTITVFFTTPGATVIGLATTKVHATSGKATPWHASSHFSAPHGMRCVLRGVAAGLATRAPPPATAPLSAMPS